MWCLLCDESHAGACPRRCPLCSEELVYADGDDAVDYIYCPRCMDAAYDPDDGTAVVLFAFDTSDRAA